MVDGKKNTIREAPQAFDQAGMAPVGRLASSMTVKAKVFKSGNSLALRLPKALGLKEGVEMEIAVAADGSLSLRPADPPRRKIDISGFAGKAPGLKPLPPELKEFEERPSTIAAREAARKAADEA